MRIGLDVDGVLSQFNKSFKDAIITTSGRDLFGPTWADSDIKTWNYPTEQYGYTREEYLKALEAVWASTNFWARLTPYEGTIEFLKKVRALSDDIYFITDRKGIKVKRQTEDWLQRYGFHDIPTVLISAKKAEVCQALGITHYIDDKVENCISINQPTKVYMMARGWNISLGGLPRLTNLDEFLKELTNESR